MITTGCEGRPKGWLFSIGLFQRHTFFYWCHDQKACRKTLHQKARNICVEHVKHFKYREDFLNRVKENARLKAEARATGSKCIAFTRLIF